MVFERTYSFTNENLTSYENIYNFKNKKVLSVIGSGDQYFSSILFGSDDIVLFDKNIVSKYYFILKFFSIKVLSYEEFYDYFVVKKVRDKNYYKKVRSLLPLEARTYFDIFYKTNMYGLLYPLSISSHKINFTTSRVIPYMSKEKYNKLQGMLKNRKLPKIIISYLESMNFNDLGKFDIMLFSNIYTYLDMDYNGYKEFLGSLKKYITQDGVIQANYIWNWIRDNSYEFLCKEKDGFYLSKVDSVRYNENEKYTDNVLTYRR